MDRDIIIGLAYFPSDDLGATSTTEVEELVIFCRRNGMQMIIGCDANCYHRTWESIVTDKRGDSLLQFNMTNNLDITYLTKHRRYSM